MPRLDRRLEAERIAVGRQAAVLTYPVRVPADADGGTVCRVVGGAAFPAPVGWVSLSWPLTEVEVGAGGIDVRVRNGVRWMTAWAMSASPGPRGTSRFTWAGLEKVTLGPRSVVFRARSGHSCRFVVLRKQRLVPILQEVEHHRVPVERVASTWRWFWDFR